MEETKDIVEILELAKKEIENNKEYAIAVLDFQDLKSLKKLYDLYIEEKEKNKEARYYMYDLMNADTPNIGTDDINNLLSILEV